MKWVTGLMKKSTNGPKQAARVILMDQAFDGYDMKAALSLKKPGRESIPTFTHYIEWNAYE